MVVVGVKVLETFLSVEELQLALTTDKEWAEAGLFVNLIPLKISGAKFPEGVLLVKHTVKGRNMRNCPNVGVSGELRIETNLHVLKEKLKTQKETSKVLGGLIEITQMSQIVLTQNPGPQGPLADHFHRDLATVTVEDLSHPRILHTGVPNLEVPLGKSTMHQLSLMDHAITQTETMCMTIGIQIPTTTGVLMKPKMIGGLFFKMIIQIGIVWRKGLLEDEGLLVKTSLPDFNASGKKESLLVSGMVRK